MKSLATAAVALLSSVSVSVRADDGDFIPGNTDLSYCKPDALVNKLTVTNVTITPNPPIAGQPIFVHATGQSVAPFTPGALMTIEFSKGIMHKAFERKICGDGGDDGSSGSMQCPTQDLDMGFAADVPEWTPRGKWKVQVVALNGGEEMGCLKGSVDIEK